jgi:prepilin-type N-terminal cleavage/methylation domain-containing protein
MKGFTLIELLVVVLIIATLSAIALPQYTKALDRSRAARYVPNLAAIVHAAKACQDENPDGRLCTSMSEIDVRVPSCEPLPDFASCSYNLKTITIGSNKHSLAYVEFSNNLRFALDDMGHKMCIGSESECDKYGFYSLASYNTGFSKSTYME